MPAAAYALGARAVPHRGSPRAFPSGHGRAACCHGSEAAWNCGPRGRMAGHVGGGVLSRGRPMRGAWQCRLRRPDPRPR
eukprot:11668596-Alexandrium_andersonii.AAC.1